MTVSWYSYCNLIIFLRSKRNTNFYERFFFTFVWIKFWFLTGLFFVFSKFKNVSINFQMCCCIRLNLFWFYLSICTIKYFKYCSLMVFDLLKYYCMLSSSVAVELANYENIFSLLVPQINICFLQILIAIIIAWQTSVNEIMQNSWHFFRLNSYAPVF